MQERNKFRCQCSMKEEHFESLHNEFSKESIVINGKTFFYDCTRKHEHGGSCLTQDMIDEISILLYDTK